MISKELLSEVLGLKIKQLDYYSDTKNTIVFTDTYKNYGWQLENIYELAHKCKEWAKYYGFKIHSGYSHEAIGQSYATPMKEKWEAGNLIMAYCPDDCPVEDFVLQTEQEAIFKACQWILDNKEK